MNSGKVSLAGLYAYPDVGRTGLCNMLFPWARAVLYAKKMNCRLIAPRWTKILRLGPWLRGERDKRYYNGQFTNTGYVRGISRALVLASSLWQRHSESESDIYDLNRGIVVFKGLGGYFNDLCGSEAYLREELMNIVTPGILAGLERLPARFIGVHVRCGDFVATRQSMTHSYYLRGIEAAKAIAGPNAPILVFSDARPDELTFLSKCGGVTIMQPAPAIHDVLSLSKASVLVGTNHSSFSEWAVFLGGMKCIWSREGRLPDGEYIGHNVENIELRDI